MTTVTAAELAELKSAHPELLIIDCRLEAEFDASHLPDAKSNCVFEIAFIDRMSALAPDKHLPVSVYGSFGSRESQVAAEKLVRAGYSNVYALEDGIETWKASNLPIDEQLLSPAPEQEPREGEYPIRVESSLLEWTGRNLASKHWGTIQVNSGFLTFQDGVPISGYVAFDTTTISSQDIQDPSLKKVLDDHLKSDDFFDVDRFPEATFSLVRVCRLVSTNLGTPNLHVEGRLTIKGTTEPIDFLANDGIDSEGNWTMQANFDIDRTSFNVFYGSGRLFKKIGMHLVNDLISIQIKLSA